jgi:hypothetical protein
MLNAEISIADLLETGELVRAHMSERINPSEPFGHPLPTREG